MIFIALGANLPSMYGTPEQTLEAAKAALSACGVKIVSSAITMLSPPWPASESAQPWYRNTVIAVETALEPLALLRELHEIERRFGRLRDEKNAPRVLDMDLIAYHDVVFSENDVHIPHSRAHQRGFVLYPLREIDAEWVHPALNRTVDALIDALPLDQRLDRAGLPERPVYEEGSA